MTRPATGGARLRKLAGLAGLLAGAGLLAACQTPPPGAPLGIVTHAVSDQDFALTPPRLGLARGIIFIRGRICRRGDSETLSPRGVLVSGYDDAGRELFRREIQVDPLLVRSDDACRRYAASLAGVLTPTRIEVRAIAYGGDAAP